MKTLGVQYDANCPHSTVCHRWSAVAGLCLALPVLLLLNGMHVSPTKLPGSTPKHALLVWENTPSLSASVQTLLCWNFSSCVSSFLWTSKGTAPSSVICRLLAPGAIQGLSILDSPAV
jgi:hypothetical protein